MARLQKATVGPLAAASATNIRTASATGVGAVVLNGTLVSGGVATLDNPRRVLFTFAADETGHNYVLAGTLSNGTVISETIVGTTAGTVSSVLSYKTVTSVTGDSVSTGNVSIGTNGVGDSGWIQFDRYATGGVAVQITVSGTVNYTLQQTLDDPNSSAYPVAPASVTWVNSSDTNVVGATTTQQSNYQFPPAWVKILLNSGTGTVSGTFIQGG